MRRFAHSFRVRRRHIDLCLSIAPAFLPSKREIVGFDACYDAEDVLARALDVFCCCKATRTESLGRGCCDFVPFPTELAR